MPGLIRGVARTAAVVGTANAVSHRQNQRYAEKDAQAQQAAAYQQQQMYAQQQQYAAPPQQQYAPPPEQYAAPAPAAPQVDLVAELTKLGELKSAGVLSDAEFEVAKAKLLNS